MHISKNISSKREKEETQMTLEDGRNSNKNKTKLLSTQYEVSRLSLLNRK